MNVLILMFIVAAVAITASVAITNRSNIKNLNELVIENRKLITQNNKLISLTNALISCSDVKTDWNKYSKVAERFGININDINRNKDITDPEG